jgi:hypothetical protein
MLELRNPYEFISGRPERMGKLLKNNNNAFLKEIKCKCTH